MAVDTTRLHVRALIGAACVTSLFGASHFFTASAQEPAAQETPAEEPSGAAPTARTDCGGMAVTDVLVNRVRGLFGRSSRSVLSRIKPGPFCPTSQVIGLERDIDNRRASDYGLVPLPEFTAYADEILEALKGASKLIGIPGSTFVTNRLDFDAQATPDGNIYITLGAVKTLESEDALAALLAHELAHVVLGHHETDLFVTIQKQIQMVGAMVQGLRRNVESIQQKARGKAAEQGTLTSRDMQLLQKVQLVIEVSDGILHPTWNRRQEQEADQFAADLTQQLGYSYGNGMKAVLGYIAAAEEKRNEAAAAHRQELQEVAQGDLGKLMAAELKQLFGFLGRRHDDADTRNKALDAYFDATYPDAAPTASKPNRFASVKDSPEVTALIRAYEDAAQAVKMLHEGDGTQALTTANRAAGQRAAAAQHGYPLLVLSQALRAQGQIKPANAALVRSTQSDEPVFKAHVQYASHLAETGNRDGAVAAIERAFELFRRAPNTYPELIGFYRNVGHKERVQQLLNECVTTLPSIRESCAERAKGI
jgi:Zn-dependent protease with chaperone function